MGEIKVVIVDDHPLFRQGVINAVSIEDDIAVIGQANDGEDGFNLIADLQPQVSILDINLPGINGLQLTRKISKKKIPSNVILITAYDDEEQLVHAMLFGAHAYLSKEIKPDELVKMIRAVADGNYIVNGRMLSYSGLEAWLHDQIEDTSRPYGDPGDPYKPLSNREMEILSYLTRGMSNKEIATLLEISHQTVKNHVTSILRKLKVDDRTQAAVFALRRGWFRLHDQEHHA
jgi:DNA-binding NarL/FixJ family response regulator